MKRFPPCVGGEQEGQLVAHGIDLLPELDRDLGGNVQCCEVRHLNPLLRGRRELERAIRRAEAGCGREQEGGGEGDKLAEAGGFHDDSGWLF